MAKGRGWVTNRAYRYAHWEIEDGWACHSFLPYLFRSLLEEVTPAPRDKSKCPICLEALGPKEAVWELMR